MITAIIANALVTVCKFLAGGLSGSAAMVNEAVHSLMDTLNQAFLFLGLREGDRPADQHYAFGHGQKKYLWNLWSAIGLFSIGAGLGLAHAWHSWHNMGHAVDPHSATLLGYAVDPFQLNLAVLGLGFLLEGFSWLIAILEVLKRMRAAGARNPLRYLFHSDDPTLVAVVLEDSVAMIGLALAAAGIALTRLTGHPHFDIASSALIAIMLGLVAFYLGWTNMRLLADVRDPEAEEAFARLALRHREVERCHDLRSIVIDEHHTLLVAQIELREEAVLPSLARRIAERRDALLRAATPHLAEDGAGLKEYLSTRAAVEATLARTEEIIDELQAQIRKELPRVTHVNVEVEGIC